jgi:hypothetical protein
MEGSFPNESEYFFTTDNFILYKGTRAKGNLLGEFYVEEHI